MYTVVDLKLPDGIGLKISETPSHRSFFSTHLNPISALSRRLVVNCEGVSWNQIPVFDYVVGEVVKLRRSIFGVRLSKGVPDYSGTTKRVNLTRIDKIIEDRKKEEHIWKSSNLCEEILLPMDYSTGTYFTGEANPDRDRLWRQLAEAASQEAARRLGTLNRSLYYQRSGRMTFRDMPTLSDFDGDTLTFQRPTAESGPSPRYVDNQQGVSEVGLDALVQAVTELTAGERGTPPASRGPRPRNQRW